MRTKAIPPAPDSLDVLREAQTATPLVPEPHESCCLRLSSRMDGVDKDEARSWLAFMEALGLVEAGELGYVRTDQAVEEEDLREAFQATVFGADELLSSLGERSQPATLEEAFETLRAHVPQWERHHNPNTWESVWRERTADLLGWAILFGLVEQEADGFVRSIE